MVSLRREQLPRIDRLIAMSRRQKWLSAGRKHVSEPRRSFKAIAGLTQHLDRLDNQIKASIRQDETAGKSSVMSHARRRAMTRGLYHGASPPGPRSLGAGAIMGAWAGATPRTPGGGKQRVTRHRSKQGPERSRRLPPLGAAPVVRSGDRATVKPRSAAWLGSMLARKPRMLVITALANKIARVVWALMAKGGVPREERSPGEIAARAWGRQKSVIGRKELWREVGKPDRENQWKTPRSQARLRDLDPIPSIPRSCQRDCQQPHSSRPDR